MPRRYTALFLFIRAGRWIACATSLLVGSCAYAITRLVWDAPLAVAAGGAAAIGSGFLLLVLADIATLVAEMLVPQ